MASTSDSHEENNAANALFEHDIDENEIMVTVKKMGKIAGIVAARVLESIKNSVDESTNSKNSKGIKGLPVSRSNKSVKKKIKRGCKKVEPSMPLYQYLQDSSSDIGERDKIIRTEIKENKFVQCDNSEKLSIVEHANDQKDDEENEVEEEKSTPLETDNVFSFGNKHMDGVEPKYKSMREEALNNAYAPIAEKVLTDVAKKCRKIYNGDLASSWKRKWSQMLKENGIKLRHLVALKLYTDFDSLQRELKKSFRFPYNEEKDRVASFYWWYKALREAFSTLSKIPNHFVQPEIVFCGISKVMSIDQFEGTYHGPVSTTTDMSIARSFAGNNGMIIVLKPERNLKKTPYKALDISWINDNPDEKEFLLLDHKISVKTYTLSSDYDNGQKLKRTEKMWFTNIDLKHFKYSYPNNEQVIQGIVNDDVDECSSYNVDIGSQSSGFVEGVHHLSVMNKNGKAAQEEYVNQIGVISENQRVKIRELGRKKRFDIAFPSYEEYGKWKVGQILSIKLDLNKHRVSFYINGFFVRDESLEDGSKYYFIAQLCSSDDMQMIIT